MDKAIKAAEVLNQGGVVIFPTETVFGVGCLINFPKSIERLYKIKKRESSQPTLVIGKDLKSLSEYVYFTPKASLLGQKFWPGPLTLVLKAKKKAPKAILGPSDSLGVRVSDHPWFKKLSNLVKVPVLAPSANFKNEPPATKTVEIDKQLIKLVDYVVDIEPGGLEPSTIVSLLDSDYNIVRNGPVTKEVIEQTLSDT